jgi:hypothetical protein
MSAKKDNAMELLDRYLQAVKKHLPWQRQDDIIAELRANLESQLEDKESELRRPLTKEEAEAWLKQIGAPMQVAARYQPQQYLIGPSLFPIYLYVLKFASLLALLVYSVVSAILIFAAADPNLTSVVAAILRVPGVLLNTAFWITLVFAIIEFAITRYGTSWLPADKFPPTAGYGPNWTPSDLSPVEKGAKGEKKPRSYAQAVAEVIFGFLLIIWLLLIPKYPFLLLGPGIVYQHLSPFQLEPIWWQFYWWIVGLNIFQFGTKLINLLYGAWQDRQPWMTLAYKALGLIPIVILFNRPTLFSLKHPELDQQQYGSTLDLINRSVHRGLLVVFAIVVLQLLVEIGVRIRNNYRERVANTH